ncbi:hypothetical protein [Flavobacterium sp.]|uniref:hypothetical protein n=1 Tax=Flavobacterium sp. TaxID=239 RepID=UPI0037533A65
MKKIALLVLLVFCGNAYSQKKKATKAIPSVLIAKGNNSSAELVKNKFYLFVNNATSKDTLLLKTYPDKGTPTDCKITTFTTKGTPMYLVAWTDKQKIETKLKTEENTITESQIWNPATKTLLIGNTQTVAKIKEIVFLDKLKTASETQEKTRRSGYEFTLLGEDFSLSDKSSSTKYIYNPTSMKYEVAKAKAATPVKKKRR